MHTAIHGLVRRYADDHRKVDELLEAIPPLAAQYELTARLVGRTREAIEFSVTRQWRAKRCTAARAVDYLGRGG